MRPDTPERQGGRPADDAASDTRAAGREVLGAASALMRSLGVFAGRAGGGAYRAARSGLASAQEARRRRQAAAPPPVEVPEGPGPRAAGTLPA